MSGVGERTCNPYAVTLDVIHPCALYCCVVYSTARESDRPGFKFCVHHLVAVRPAETA